MKRLEVEAILKFYRHIDIDIKVMSEWMEQYEAGYNPLGTKLFDGMPQGNSLSDPTAQLAVKIADTDIKEMIRILKSKIEELKKLRTEIMTEISELTPVYKTIICGFYIKGQKWERVAEQINYSIRQSKNIRCAALESLGRNFAGNRTISKSEIIEKIIK